MEMNWKVRSSMFVLVTPQIALDWLIHRNKLNRAIRKTNVAQLQADLEAGRFTMNGEPITFDWNGQIINGQHRLEAIHASQIAVEMLIVTGLDPATRPTVDNQGKRSIADVFELAGNGMLLGGKGSVPPNTAAGMWARVMHGILNRKGTETRAQILQFADQHREAGLFALNLFATNRRVKHVCVAPVMAAVARAFYHYPDHGKLARFVEVLCTGMTRSRDEDMVIVLRESLIGASKRIKGGVNSNGSAPIYGKAARAIQCYMRGEIISRLYEPTEEPFPLPHRTPAETAPRLVGMAGNVRGQQPGEPRADLVAQAAGR